MTTEAPVFFYKDASIDYPQRSSRQPANKFEQRFLKSSRDNWSDFCKITLHRLTHTPSPLLDTGSLTPVGLEEHFVLAKSSIRRDVLGLDKGQKGLRLAYQYFVIGRNIPYMSQDNPHLDVTRRELFQLYCLQVAHQYNCMGAAGIRLFTQESQKNRLG